MPLWTVRGVCGISEVVRPAVPDRTLRGPGQPRGRPGPESQGRPDEGEDSGQGLRPAGCPPSPVARLAALSGKRLSVLLLTQQERSGCLASFLAPSGLPVRPRFGGFVPDLDPKRRRSWSLAGRHPAATRAVKEEGRVRTSDHGRAVRVRGPVLWSVGAPGLLRGPRRGVDTHGPQTRPGPARFRTPGGRGRLLRV